MKQFHKKRQPASLQFLGLGPAGGSSSRCTGGGSSRVRRSRGANAFVRLDRFSSVHVVLVVDELIGVNAGRGRVHDGHWILCFRGLDRRQAQAVVLVDGQVVAPLTRYQQLVEGVRDEVRVRDVNRALRSNLGGEKKLSFSKEF